MLKLALMMSRIPGPWDPARHPARTLPCGPCLMSIPSGAPTTVPEGALLGLRTLLTRPIRPASTDPLAHRARVPLTLPAAEA